MKPKESIQSFSGMRSQFVWAGCVLRLVFSHTTDINPIQQDEFIFFTQRADESESYFGRLCTRIDWRDLGELPVWLRRLANEKSMLVFLGVENQIQQHGCQSPVRRQGCVMLRWRFVLLLTSEGNLLIGKTPQSSCRDRVAGGVQPFDSKLFACRFAVQMCGIDFYFASQLASVGWQVECGLHSFLRTITDAESIQPIGFCSAKITRPMCGFEATGSTGTQCCSGGFREIPYR